MLSGILSSLYFRKIMFKTNLLFQIIYVWTYLLGERVKNNIEELFVWVCVYSQL